MKPFQSLLTTVAALAIASSAFAQEAVPYRIDIEHDLPSGVSVTDSIILDTNPNFNGGSSTWSFSFSGTGSFSNPFEYSEIPAYLTVFGLYEDGDQNTGVTVLARASLADQNVGLPWEDVFLGGFTEAEVAEAITRIVTADGDEAQLNAGFSVIDPFYAENFNLWPTEGEAGIWLGFSDASDFGAGQWTATPVPEPASLLVLAAGAGLMAARRFRSTRRA
ncbi:MAG: PEP-CTERM sorting domain-containing protein [Fimbriimonadaceae bacterium]|nr:PEP-CTERM sorting domain-containing protein [Fimbriimonadaceae bacterium]